MADKVSVSRDALLKAWKLITTKEWPFEHLGALGAVHNEFTQALEEADANVEVKES